MKVKNKKLQQMLEKYQRISVLGEIGAVLEWDLNVNLPPKGAEGRAKQSAFITELQTDYWNDPSFKEILEELQKEKLEDENAKALVRNLTRGSVYYYKVPKEIIIKKSNTASKAYMAWQAAKKANKFSDFLPLLKELVELDKVIAGHLGYKKNPYDALLDLYEQELTVADCEKAFGKLQPAITKLLGRIQKSKGYTDNVELVSGQLKYPADDQRQIALFALKKMGFDMDGGRMDISAHPFTSGLTAGDIRFTTWYHETDFRDSFTAAMHEGGHALYEQGVNPEYHGTPLEHGVSYAIHESQSRLWENQVGRHPEFIKYMVPIFQAFYPEQLGKVSEAEIIKAVNHVAPSLIRVEADEVTYNLHIIIRFELENALINEKLKAEDLPEAWREKVKKYLRIEVPTDREGVLQDVHWSMGAFGYFPSYSFGNLYAAQIVNKMKSEIDFEGVLRSGELGTILYWLKENIHESGSLIYPKDLIKKVTGEELNPQYFIDYLIQKYSTIYSL